MEQEVAWVLEILIVFMAAVGVILVCWCLMGLLLSPVFGHNMLTLCFSEGDGGRLELQIRAYGWLRDGKISGGRFVIVDCGLDASGIHRAQLLQNNYDWVEYCPHEMLNEHLQARKISDTSHSPA